MTRQAAEARGRAAEGQAADLLRGKGFSIVGERIRTPAGEIDLIARRPGLLIFVEVKARRTAHERDWSLDRRALVRVAAAADALIERYAEPGDDIRIDAVLIAPGQRPRHLENVWEG